MKRNKADDANTAETSAKQIPKEALQAEIAIVLKDLETEDLADILNEAQKRQRLRFLERRFEQIQSQFFEVSKDIV